MNLDDLSNQAEDFKSKAPREYTVSDHTDTKPYSPSTIYKYLAMQAEIEMGLMCS